MGISVGDTPDSLLHNASMHCLGSLHAVKGNYNTSGFCVYTRPDGDLAYLTYEATGQLGGGSKGTYKWVGGTGKLTGLEGGGEYTSRTLRPAAEGNFSAINKGKGNWKLP
jgi:hypothetical protein